MEPEKKSHGALIGSIIIIVILLIGGIYIWQSKMKNVVKENATQTEEQATINSENAQTSTELNNLDQEINTTDTNTGVDVNKIQ